MSAVFLQSLVGGFKNTGSDNSQNTAAVEIHYLLNGFSVNTALAIFCVLLQNNGDELIIRWVPILD